MKHCKKFVILSLFTCNLVLAQEFKSPDILIDSKLDYDFSGVLVSKFRRLLKNFNLEDPFIGKISTPLLLNESVISEYLPQDSKDLLSGFGNAVGLSILKAETKVWLHGLSYDVKGFKTDLKATETLKDGLVIGTDFSASEVNLSADKVSLSLVIPGENHSPVFTVDIIRPMIKANEKRLVNFYTKIKIQDNVDSYKLKILEANFDQMALGLMSNPDSVDLSYERLIIPELKLQVGNKIITFSSQKIEKLIREKHQAIKGILMAEAANMLKKNTITAAFGVLEQYKFNKEYWFDISEIQSQISIKAFSSSKAGDNIEINIPGDFCTTQKFHLVKSKCLMNKVTKTSKTRLDPNLHKISIKTMKALTASGDANFVASISEDYINKLLVTTYDVGIWKKSLDQAGVTIGPNNVIMRLDKLGDSGTLIMDVIYVPNKLEKFLTGSEQVRFPLILNISVRIEKNNNIPVVTIRINDVDTSDETLLYGRPKENILSNLKDMRFKSKILKVIREKLAFLRNKDIIELPLPEFVGLGLHKVDFISDGTGRMNATMRLEDLIDEKD